MVNQPNLKANQLTCLVSLLASVSFTTIAVVTHSQPGFSQPIPPDDFICFLNMGGRVIDLSQICGKSVVLSGTDQTFLSTYQTLLDRRTQRLPSTQRFLAQAQANPTSVIQRAQQACAAIEGGAFKLAFPTSENPDADVVNKLALAYYCPDLND